MYFFTKKENNNYMQVALYNRNFDEAHIPLLQHLFDLLAQHNVNCLIYKDFYERVKSGVKFHNPPRFFKHAKEIQEETSFFISLGGDGTMLDTVTFVRGTGIPVVGINLGRLGFLAIISKDKIKEAIDSLLSGAYRLDHRSLLHLDSSSNLFGETPFALNEFTIHRKDSSSMIKIHTFLNGAFLNTYWADGLIISTPTGSTGYSLSCNGPVIFPQSASFVITPVAPHNLNIRPMVVPDDSVISFEVEGRSDQFLCTMDSRVESITADLELAVRKEDFTFSLVRANNHNFLDSIRQKLYWGMDSRN